VVDDRRNSQPSPVIDRRSDKGLTPSAQRLLAIPGQLLACMQTLVTILNAMLRDDLPWNPKCD
jgi:hypothetical protein